MFEKYDLLIASDGLNSRTRKHFWKDSEPFYSGFGLYHSTHKLHPEVKEKLTVIMPNKRIGITPISKDEMYLWASTPQPEKKYIDPADQPRSMYEEFQGLSGFLNDVIDELINEDIYVHYTSVDEVRINDVWHDNRIVLLGDAAHASTPFMAQGGAMAMQDACTLAKLINEIPDLNEALTKYAKLRIPVVKKIQDMSKKAGMAYLNPIVDLEKTQQFLNEFYLDQSNFY
jgi:2-polyprenyl-6-methoxyphenol hydroxylase-like FAD-dependent oxidoreductase